MAGLIIRLAFSLAAVEIGCSIFSTKIILAYLQIK